MTNGNHFYADIIISGTGVFNTFENLLPSDVIYRHKLYADIYNSTNKSDISQGNKVALELSSEEFIYKASGIKNRYVMDKIGILDPNIMHPKLLKRIAHGTCIFCKSCKKSYGKCWKNIQ